MRVVNPVTPGLRGPEVIRRRDGLQGPAHAGGKGALQGAARAAGLMRPVFFLNPWGEDRSRSAGLARSRGLGTDSFVKGLILAQNERWRRGLGMQVERAWLQDQVSGARVSKATATNPMVGHSRGKLRVIPSDVRAGHPV